MRTTLLEQLFQRETGLKPETIEQLPSAGSNRHYFRIKANEKTLVGVVGTSIDENKAFITLAKHFKEKGLSVPQIYHVSDDYTCYLQEDLGDELLFDTIKKGRLTTVFSKEEKILLKKTMQQLPKIQFKGAEDLDFSCCYPQPEFDQRSILWDLNYFKYSFLKAVGLDFQENKLEDDFETMVKVLLKSQTNSFMYRDFQSRNVMIKDNTPYFIDFQGGRKGPIFYDVASFLWQAKANYPNDLRYGLIDEYLKALQPFYSISKEDFLKQLRHFVLFRTLQVLGAYGFRGYFEKKPHFIQSVPFAIRNLREILSEPFTEYPYMNDMLNQLVNMKQFSEELRKRILTVTIYSFAYKKGIPNDVSGNGGGYVFDCRAIDNPGKYERYNAFNGLDEPVIRFLEENGEIETFLTGAKEMTDKTIQRYIDRGFTNLMICFGCTGGQHRSVYAAQKMAEHIHNNFPVKVHLFHREQNIEHFFDLKQ